MILSAGGCAARTADQLPAARAQVAKKLYSAALTCDPEPLIATASDDETNLSFAVITYEEAFAVPRPEADAGFMNRYDALVTLLAMPPAEETSGADTTYVWPRVHTLTAADDDAAWQEVVDAGLIDAAEVDQMRAGSGYLGYRTGITRDGRWQFMIAGD